MKPPAQVDFDGRGKVSFKSLDLAPHDQLNNFSCPETHFQCPGIDYYCLPVYVRCNDVYDCPGKEDEAACDSYTCPGFYRCRASSICLHESNLCDGVIHCPLHDDELLCDVTCPEGCTCYGLSFLCTSSFPASNFPGLRFLNARGTGMTSANVSTNSLLIHLSLAECGLTHLDMPHLPNLRSLDVSDNMLAAVGHAELEKLINLRVLSLTGNPLTQVTVTPLHEVQTLPSLLSLDVSRIPSPELNVHLVYMFPNLETLNMSGSGVERVQGEGFQLLEQLRVLDLRGCPMTEFPRDVFQGLDQLHTVFADNYKLCCPDTLPTGFNDANCHAPADEISSCDALLRSDFYRALLSIFAALSLLGNMGSFVYRAIIDKASSSQGFGVFVTHLCIADFFMGVYLAVIGVADRLYQGNYLWKDREWKHSTACKAAGFLSLLSSEVSAFIICLITLDRFLVLRFPFSHFHFKRSSAHVACVIVWAVGLVLAAVPLLPVTSHWEFYSQTGICIPLPITRNDFAGHTYSFSVVIILNFVLFLMIAVGQVFIYWSIRTNSITASDTTQKSKDLTIARRLITIAISDFLCWFPIGLLGLLAADGVPVPGEVNVIVAIIVLPINSALNPFLYTLNMLLERQRRAQERRVSKLVMSQLHTRHSEISYLTPEKKAITYTEDEAWGLLRTWLISGLLAPGAVKAFLEEPGQGVEEDNL
nr:hypothetical protein BaRGS_027126 [Batillaria attramentaria]